MAQAIDGWEPTLSAPHIEILWGVEKVLVQFVNLEDLTQDPSLVLEAMDAWKRFLASHAIRPLFKAEKKKNSGIHNGWGV
jgi:hypothetical protein